MFQDRIAAAANAVQACLDEEFTIFGEVPLADAMRYAAAGGKRLRAFLVLESAALHDVGQEQAIYAAAAIEAMHAYSLVHDDLPCMDDDDLRRGQPTVHVKWDEATAVLVGDALQAFAFEMLADARLSSDAAIRLELVSSMASAAGGRGMVRGQALDIAAETSVQPYSLEMVEETQALKTGALIEWSATAGAVIAGVDPTYLGAYATALGRAFQIADDILDVTGDSTKAGKRLGKDADAGKATFVSLLGLEGAKKRAKLLVDQADAALEPYGDKAQTLREAARFVISREV